MGYKDMCRTVQLGQGLKLANNRVRGPQTGKDRLAGLAERCFSYESLLGLINRP